MTQPVFSLDVSIESFGFPEPGSNLITERKGKSESSVSRKLRGIQMMFISIAVCYLLFLLSSSFYAVRYKYSEGDGNSVEEARSTDKNSKALTVAKSEDGSTVYIKNFYRFEMKAGQPSWEVRGTDAEYLPQQGVTRINNADVLFYRPNNSEVHLRAREARLFIQGTEMERAYLEGEVKVVIDNSINVEANSGLYDKQEDRVEGYGDCHIYGEGYNVYGDSLLLKIGEETISVNQNVRSNFLPHQVQMGNFKAFSESRKKEK